MTSCEELIADIEEFLNDMQSELFEENIQNIELNEDESEYNNPIIDEGVKGFRFSYHLPRRCYEYNCLIKEENNQVVFKVITHDDEEVIYKEYQGIKSVKDFLEILTKKVYHLHWYEDENGDWVSTDTRPEKIQEKIEKNIIEIETELIELEKIIEKKEIEIMALIYLMIGKKDCYILPDIARMLKL